MKKHSTRPSAGVAIGLAVLICLGAGPSWAQDTEPSCTATSFFTLIRSTTVLLGIQSNNDGGVQTMAQWFDAPEPITLFGFSFYAIVPEDGSPVDLTASAYLPDADGFPTGVPLASTTVTVSREFAPLPEVRLDALFDSPIDVTEPYLLVVENDSPTLALVGMSDPETKDGQGEGLASMFFGGRWSRAIDLNFGGEPIDSDFVFLPRYGLDLEVDIETSDACLDGPGSLDFEAVTSPLLTSRFYNADPDGALSWFFGPGMPVAVGESVSNAFPNAGPWTVQLTGLLAAGDGSGCVVDAERGVGTAPQGLAMDFVEDFSELSVDFTASADGADTWSWDFGAGGTSDEQNPTYAYGSLGFFDACVNAGNLCGEASVDGVCHPVLSPFSDLSVAIGTASGFAEAGALMSYTITVTNVSGVASGAQTLRHILPAELTGATWSCTVFGGGSCTTAGAGSIDETILLDPLSFLTFTVVGTYDPAGLEPLVLLAEASVPVGDVTADNSDRTVIQASAAQIFWDGFESESTDAWTSTVPAPPQ